MWSLNHILALFLLSTTLLLAKKSKSSFLLPLSKILSDYFVLRNAEADQTKKYKAFSLKN